MNIIKLHYRKDALIMCRLYIVHVYMYHVLASKNNLSEISVQLEHFNAQLSGLPLAMAKKT
jgi:hypothetical protein